MNKVRVTVPVMSDDTEVEVTFDPQDVLRALDGGRVTADVTVSRGVEMPHVSRQPLELVKAA